MKSWWKSKFGNGGRDDSEEDEEYPEITNNSDRFNHINGYLD